MLHSSLSLPEPSLNCPTTSFCFNKSHPLVTVTTNTQIWAYGATILKKKIATCSNYCPTHFCSSNSKLVQEHHRPLVPSLTFRFSGSDFSPSKPSSIFKSCSSSTTKVQLGMGVVTVSTSTVQTPLRLNTRFPNRCPLKRPWILALKSDQLKSKSLAVNHESILLPTENPNEQNRLKKVTKSLKRVKAVAADETLACNIELDYNEAAAKLESIYQLSPPTDLSDVEGDHRVMKRHCSKKKTNKHDEKAKKEASENVVRNHNKLKRLRLDERISLRKKGKEVLTLSWGKKTEVDCEDIERLVKEYSVSTDLVSLDWKKTKIPPVLSSSEHARLFKLMQPMKALIQVKEGLHNALGREPTDGELAASTNMNGLQVRKYIKVGQAARNKLIKHNLRLVPFAMSKYFQEISRGPRYHDFCQAGARGLITAIDRFEPKRTFRLSTYALLWIRHTIIRSMTLSSFTRVSFGLESVRLEIQRAKLELIFELDREPRDEELIEKVGISPQRYHEVIRASKPVFSLHTRHSTTGEEFINEITDVDGIGGDNRRHPALLRLALDDVLDSLKPMENLVMRQRYGLDGRGNRALGEIAGNLKISREMVRKHELKALLKLKHPTRVDYLRRYVF